MSSLVSNVIERTFSQSHSQLITKTFRGLEDEIATKINSFRLRIPSVKEKLQEIIKESSNPEDCTINFKEINKIINYESQENIDKLMNYLDYLSELKHTIPDFFNTPYLNTVFTRNFSVAIDSQEGLLLKSAEHSEKLKKLIPSRQYLGLHMPNIDIRDIESTLCFIILEEYLMLSRKDAACLRTDNLVIEIDGGDAPQHISIFNPSFNTLVVYSNERDQQLYLLFLTDVLELMGPDSAEFPYASRIETHDALRAKSKMSRLVKTVSNEKTMQNKKKYENLKVTLPDITLEQTQKFVKLIDSDSDDRLVVQDVINLVRKHKVYLDDEYIEKMFDEIFEKRCVVVETQRKKPVDPYEIFHAIRLKYKKENDTQQWTHSGRPYRDTWLMLMKLVGIELPKHGLPPVKSHKLLCNYETDFALTGTIGQQTAKNIIVKEKRPEILKKQYKPEANILIQNTQNIMELYLDDRDHHKTEDSNKTAFQTLVNAKFGDLTQKSEFPTVDFSTQGYYKEALRLSKDPELYLTEKVNPIYKFMPVKKDYVYQQHTMDYESLKDTKSGINSDDVEFDDSVDPLPGSKRVTLHTIKDPSMLKSKSMRSTKPILHEIPKYFGSTVRQTSLSSSMKERAHSPSSGHGKPIFHTAFKALDSESLKAHIAKMEPVLDPYNNPTNHMFRDEQPAEGKPQFVSTWKDGIPDMIKNTNAGDHRPREVLELELYEREMALMKARGIEKNQEPWIRYFKLAPRNRGFVDNKYPDFLKKGDYQDGYVRAATFIRNEVEVPVPFKLVHRSLRKTDKNLFMGDEVKM